MLKLKPFDLSVYDGRSQEELACMTLGALAVWALAAPERFGMRYRRRSGSGLTKLMQRVLHEQPRG